MATATRQSSRGTSVKPESVSSAIAYLEALPEKQKEDMSLREAIGQMQEMIKAALNRGYSYEDVAKMLSEQGIQISALTLKNYAPSGRRQATKDKVKRGRKPAEEAITSDAPPEATSAPETDEPTPVKRRGRRPAAVATSAAPETTAEKPRRGRKPAAPKEETKPTRGRRKAKTSS